MKVATAFSGGLAALEFALRYEDIKHEVVFACEWDKYARKQYLEFHREPQTFYNDISDLNATKYKDEIDLFVWGSPCQDLSLAGKRKGFDGEKSSLFREGARVMSEMMPKTFIFENVKGLLSSNGGADYKEVIKTFQDLGYLIAMKVLNAKEHGTAQNRERVFVVGFLDESAYHAFSFEDKVPLKKVLRDYLEDDVDEKYYLSDKAISGMMGSNSVSKERFLPKDLSDKYATCLDTREGGRITNNFLKIKSATSKGYETATQNGSINFTHPDSKTRRERVGKGVAQTLDCSCNQGVIEQKIATNIKDSVRKNFIRDYNKIINSNKAVFYSDCDSGFQDNKVCITESSCLRANNDNIFALDTEYRIRKLTPKECFKLQGIKDEDINLINSDTQSYKIAGNAIEVGTIRSIIRALYKKQSTNNLFDFQGVA